MHEDEIQDLTNEEEIPETASDDIIYEETDESGAEQYAGGKMKDLRTQLAEAKKERDEYLAGWQKAKADYINLQKDSEKARALLRSHIQIDNVYDILPVVDSFQMAMAGEAWESVDSNWRMGVEYIYQQLWKVLEGYGVSEINEINVPFDPNTHEPMEIETITDESQQDQILGIIQKGYRMGDRILRAAKVKVGKLED